MLLGLSVALLPIYGHIDSSLAHPIHHFILVVALLVFYHIASQLNFVFHLFDKVFGTRLHFHGILLLVPKIDISLSIDMIHLILQKLLHLFILSILF